MFDWWHTIVFFCRAESVDHHFHLSRRVGRALCNVVRLRVGPFLEGVNPASIGSIRSTVVPADVYQTSLVVIQLLYLFTMLSIKLSILSLYLRLFGVSDRFRWATYVTAAMIVLCYVALVVVAILSTISLHFIVVPIKSAKISAVSNLVTDAFVLFLPLRMVLRLKVGWPTKAKLIGLFLLGLL